MGPKEELDAIPPQHHVTITTDRLVLRAVRASDILVMHKMRQDPATMQYMTSGVEAAEDPYTSYSFTRMKIMTRPDGYCFAVCQKIGPSSADTSPDHPVIGFMGIFRDVECGYLLTPATWGKGYATEALRAFVASYWAEFPQGLPGISEKERNVLNAYVFEGNAGSERVLEKAGFKEIRKEMVDLPTGKTVRETVFQTQRPGADADPGTAVPAEVTGAVV